MSTATLVAEPLVVAATSDPEERIYCAECWGDGVEHRADADHEPVPESPEPEMPAVATPSTFTVAAAPPAPKPVPPAISAVMSGTFNVPVAETGALATRALLVGLKISRWSARKTDKRVNAEVANTHSTKEDAGNYTKRLLPWGNELYDAIYTAEYLARLDHIKHTLPWLDDGDRILPSANYLTYTEIMRGHRADFERAVAAFVVVYPQLREEARSYLNGLWKAEDYPPADKIGARFGFVMRKAPLPVGADFRVSLPDGEIDLVRQQIEDATRETAALAMREAWTRLRDAIVHLHSQAAKDTGPVRWDSMLGNLRELCDVLPRLNLLADPNLDRLTDEVRTSILRVTPEMARDKKSGERARIAEEAERLATAMKGLMA